MHNECWYTRVGGKLSCDKNSKVSKKMFESQRYSNILLLL